ncbi:MAG: group II intron reverse transcriptase/maturase [Actinomycetota bacterium]
MEASVWTERMLAALDRGVKGGRWYSLMDKVRSEDNLRAAFARVKANGGSAGADHQTIEMFGAHLEENLEQLRQELESGTYRPRPARRVWIAKPGRKGEERPLDIPAVRDRVVQTALRHVLEPIFEREFAEHSYGFRPGRGNKDALRRVEQLLKAGKAWVVDADLKNFFGTVSHDILLSRLKEKVSDGKVLELIEAFLKHKVLEGMEGWEPEAGTPQGAVISPLLSNVYLDPLDREMERQGHEMVRYADDLVILSGSEAEARNALAALERWTTSVGLALHPEKTRVVDATEPGGFDFLGYHFERGMRWPSAKNLKKLRDKIRAKTKRTNGFSLEVIIWKVNQTLVGWFGYFKHSHWTTFTYLDPWIRMRLRSILRRRKGLVGRGRGADHVRWPNAFFAEQGLFSLVAAHAEASQSAVR